ncbi:MAG: cation:dicarboxylase symporter family transporter, partial [Ignavibacteria bacterium]|nr:cation:dicarboxylase symporter family transporter [Ignavibacteria bacterium]
MKKKLPLHIKILIGLLSGLIIGLLCNVFLPGNPNVSWFVTSVAYPVGQIFLRMIFMIIVPLIFTAIVLGVADFRDLKKIGRIGGKVLIFTIIITAVSVVIGMTLVNVFQPGTGMSEQDRATLIQTITNKQNVGGILTSAREAKSFTQIIVDIIPRNPFVDIVGFLDPN